MVLAFYMYKYVINLLSCNISPQYFSMLLTLQSVKDYIIKNVIVLEGLYHRNSEIDYTSWEPLQYI